MQKKLLIPSILFALLLTGCNNNQTPNGNPGELGPLVPGDPPVVVVEYVEYTIDFEHFDLGYNELIQSSDDDFNPTVLAYIQTQTDLVTDFEASDANSVRIKKDEFAGGYGSAQGLIIGSQTADGDITLGFSQKLAYVKVKAQQYYNIQTRYDNLNNQQYLDPNYDSGTDYVEDDSEDGYHFEGHFSLIVGEEIWIGPGEGYEYDADWNPVINIPEVVEKEFDINSDILTIEGFASERARIYSITLGFEA